MARSGSANGEAGEGTRHKHCRGDRAGAGIRGQFVLEEDSTTALVHVFGGELENADLYKGDLLSYAAFRPDERISLL